MPQHNKDFSDWVFTEKAQDRGSARVCCGLCGHRNLRYVFQVRNQRTGLQMWVGSSCIQKFGLVVLDGSMPLSRREVTAKLRRITRHLRS